MINIGANGNAWFVTKVKKVNSANDEMSSLATINSKKEAIINTKDFSKIGDDISEVYALDSTSSVRMLSYDVNRIVYESNANIEAPIVFSEIYYPEGWNCYIDGEKTDHIFRANYILRGALVPAGKHLIEWKFEPDSFTSSSTTSMIGSIFLFVFVLGSFGFYLFGKWKTSRKD
jgi:uncharacterized membrane protein YfhO